MEIAAAPLTAGRGQVKRQQDGQSGALGVGGELPAWQVAAPDTAPVTQYSITQSGTLSGCQPFKALGFFNGVLWAPLPPSTSSSSLWVSLSAHREIRRNVHTV